MNYEHGKTVRYAAGFVAAVVVILGLASIIAGCANRNTQLYTENGYTQVQGSGTISTYWVKFSPDSTR